MIFGCTFPGPNWDNKVCMSSEIQFLLNECQTNPSPRSVLFPPVLFTPNIIRLPVNILAFFFIREKRYFALRKRLYLLLCARIGVLCELVVDPENLTSAISLFCRPTQSVARSSAISLEFRLSPLLLVSGFRDSREGFLLTPPKNGHG